LSVVLAGACASPATGVVPALALSLLSALASPVDGVVPTLVFSVSPGRGELAVPLCVGAEVSVLCAGALPDAEEGACDQARAPKASTNATSTIARELLNPFLMPSPPAALGATRFRLYCGARAGSHCSTLTIRWRASPHYLDVVFLSTGSPGREYFFLLAFATAHFAP
jgi:hypothetical protein